MLTIHVVWTIITRQSAPSIPWCRHTSEKQNNKWKCVIHFCVCRKNVNVNNEKAKRQLLMASSTDWSTGSGKTTREAVLCSYNCQRSHRVCIKDEDLCTLIVQQVAYPYHALIIALMKSPLTLMRCSRMHGVAMYQLSFSQSQSLIPMTDLY